MTGDDRAAPGGAAQRSGSQPAPATVTGLRTVVYLPLDVPHVSRTASWPEAQLLRLKARGHWRVPQEGTGLALQAYGHTTLDALLRTMPSVVLEARGAQLLDAAGLAEEDRDRLQRPTEGWRLAGIQMTLWNLGVGLAMLSYDLPPGSAEDPTRLVERTRDHAYGVQRAVGALAKHLLAAEDAVVLWANPVYVLDVEEAALPRARWALAASVTANGLDCPLDEFPSSALRVGRHSSAVSSSRNDAAVDLLLRLAAVHQVCWAAALIYDARLSGEMGSMEPDNPKTTIGDLEKQATRILATYHLVRLFRLRYGAVEAHLDPGASLVWHALETNWKFPKVLAALDDRLDFVRTFHGQLLTRLQDQRAQLLNQLVIAFTFLNLFSIALAAMTFAGLEALTVQGAAAAAMVLVLLVNVGVYLYFRRRADRHQ